MSMSFLIKEAFRSLLRSKRLNLVSLGAMSMSLMALGLVFILTAGIFNLTKFIEEKVEVVAFLNDQMGETGLEKFLATIREHPQVDGVEHISKEKALQEFSGDPTIKEFLDALGDNPLPASARIRLRAKTPVNVQRFTTWMKNLPGVEDASYGGGDADRLLKAMQFIRLAVLALAASLVMAAVIIIANIISLMVYARQEEISIMRIIGATNWFIRGPLLIWGIIQGAAGGLAAAGLLAALWQVVAFYALRELAIDLRGMLPPGALKYFLAGATGLMLTGSILGLAGSLVSVGRELLE